MSEQIAGDLEIQEESSHPTPTPRTDAAQMRFGGFCSDASLENIYSDCLEFSRQLERELIAMTEAAEGLVNALNINDGIHASAYWRRMKYEALSKFTALSTHHEQNVREG